MHASLNEIESLCKKAARGAGLSWGLAEEAGKAARWLSAHGLDGPGVLAQQLQENDGCAYAQLAPDVSAEPWQGPGHALCPLIAGATLSDHAHLLRHNGDIELRHVAHPQLLLPFASSIARQLGMWLELSWEACRLRFAPTGEAWLIQAQSLGAASTAQVRCASVPPAEPLGKALVGKIPELGDSPQHDLDHLAARTYVPASEASRLLGAGAGLSDNN
ncbi:DUF3726 domain-containing protein [Pseudomonas protegens]|uniref:DUF3726 domain-containing protein n=1 Tax=Pseudomonas protegens TaxID=380021 RepID=A0A2T6GLV6_9PSED|nr:MULTISPECIES: DUF3726 domain-containing protein [Pseudomonas]PUA45145.1 DUF3726 domain-containing protein [Pseudomonas protegens]ULT70017.1 DUF3726 domain-containing protein [Pseudomonas sp. BC42]